MGGSDAAVQLWGVATLKERRTFAGHPGGVRSLAFAPDGHTLVTGGADSTVLVWDVTGRGQAAAARPLSAAHLERLWADLASNEANRAHAAMRALVAAPRQTVSWLGKRLQPLPVQSAARLAKLLSELDDRRFVVRDQATAELGADTTPELTGTAAAPETAWNRLPRKADGGWSCCWPRAETTALSESQMRTPAGLRGAGLIGSAEVRPLLEGFHQGQTAAVRLGQEARASLERLRKGPRDTAP